MGSFGNRYRAMVDRRAGLSIDDVISELSKSREWYSEELKGKFGSSYAIELQKTVSDLDEKLAKAHTGVNPFAWKRDQFLEDDAREIASDARGRQLALDKINMDKRDAVRAARRARVVTNLEPTTSSPMSRSYTAPSKASTTIAANTPVSPTPTVVTKTTLVNDIDSLLNRVEGHESKIADIQRSGDAMGASIDNAIAKGDAIIAKIKASTPTRKRLDPIPTGPDGKMAQSYIDAILNAKEVTPEQYAARHLRMMNKGITSYKVQRKLVDDRLAGGTPMERAARARMNMGNLRLEDQLVDGIFRRSRLTTSRLEVQHNQVIGRFDRGGFLDPVTHLRERRSGRYISQAEIDKLLAAIGSETSISPIVTTPRITTPRSMLTPLNAPMIVQPELGGMAGRRYTGRPPVRLRANIFDDKHFQRVQKALRAGIPIPNEPSVLAKIVAQNMKPIALATPPMPKVLAGFSELERQLGSIFTDMWEQQSTINRAQKRLDSMKAKRPMLALPLGQVTIDKEARDAAVREEYAKQRLIPNPVQEMKTHVPPAPIHGVESASQKMKYAAMIPKNAKEAVREGTLFAKYISRETLTGIGKFFTAKRLAWMGTAAVGGALSLMLIKELHDAHENVQVEPHKEREYSDFGSPLNMRKVITRGTDQLNNAPRVMLPSTMGLTQQLDSNKINHELWGAARSRDQMSRLFRV